MYVYIGVVSLSVHDYMSCVMCKAWFTIRRKASQSLQCNKLLLRNIHDDMKTFGHFMSALKHGNLR